jgi:hypothetical protein
MLWTFFCGPCLLSRIARASPVFVVHDLRGIRSYTPELESEVLEISFRRRAARFDDFHPPITSRASQLLDSVELRLHLRLGDEDDREKLLEPSSSSQNRLRYFKCWIVMS